MTRHSRARLRATAVVLPFAVAVASLARPAAAQTKAECLAAFDHAQELRKEMKLRAARDEFRSCARDACSPPVRKDCSEQLEELSRDTPSLVIGARDEAGADVEGTAVFVDGERVTSAAGFPIALDPGRHTLRFEHPPWEPVEQSLIVRVGERNRLVVVTFKSAASTPARVGEQPSPPVATSRSVSPWVFVAGGVGVAALGSFAFFGITGLNERSNLERTCAPNCTDDVLGGVRTRFIAADVSLGIAVVSLAAAAVLYLVDRSVTRSAALNGDHFFARSF
jgi:hypothetical protein